MDTGLPGSLAQCKELLGHHRLIQTACIACAQLWTAKINVLLEIECPDVTVWSTPNQTCDCIMIKLTNGMKNEHISSKPFMGLGYWIT